MRTWLIFFFVINGLVLNAQQSRFNTDAACWTTEGDASAPSFNTTGGHPTGFIQAADLGTGGTWYFSAPSPFLGNKTASFQRKLRFDWQTDHPGSSYDGKDVVLEGAGQQIYFAVASPPGISWSTATVLLDSMGWKHMLTGATVSRATFKTVLGGLTKLLIRGEFSNKLDVGGLDNVLLEPYDSIGFASGAACQDSCFSFSDFSGVNAASWSWQFPGAQPFASNLQNPFPVCFPATGNYTVTLIARNTCLTDTVVRLIKVQQQNARFDTAIICNGASFLLPAGRSVNVAGNYTDTLKSTQGCDSTIVHTALYLTPAIRDSVSTVNATCYDRANGAAAFHTKGAPPFLYEVNGQTIPGNALSQLLGGKYSYRVTDSFGCSIAGSFTVARPEPLSVLVFPSDTTVESGSEVVFHAVANYDSVQFQWEPAASFSCSNCDSAGVKVNDNSAVYVTALAYPAGTACTTRVPAYVHVLPEIYLPTAFTPNGDGRNDVFRLAGKNTERLTAFRIAIFDRWGKLVFQSSEPTFKWTAENAETGVYVYHMEYFYQQNRSVSGNVTVLR